MIAIRPPFLLIAALLALVAPGAAEESQSIRELKVQEILQATAGADNAGIWVSADRLAALGPSYKRIVTRSVKGATIEGKLAALRALIDLDSPTFAAERLMELATDEKVKLDHRLVALELIGLTEEIDAEDGLLELMVAYNPRLRLAAARALWRLDSPRSHRAKSVLREFLKSADLELRAQGALALAEMGDAETPGVMALLQALRKEPGLRGQLADALYRKLQLRRTIQMYEARADKAGVARRDNSRWRHLDEIRSLLRREYDLLENIDDEALRAGAARGMVDFADDPHTIFLSPEQYQEFLHGNDGVDPSYGGIGAFIDTNVTDTLRILRPIFGGPAWKADIRGGDDIVAVDGEPTAGKQITEIIKQVKGPPGTTVVLSIYREGWTEPRAISVIRAKIVLPTVVSRMLPGKIGYVSIAQFAFPTGAELFMQLRKLEAEGLRGLVIDLRDNPGGLLGAVKQCLTLFLEEREFICSIKGRAHPRAEKHFAARADQPRRYPISVLVNGRSASGAELMSGVLQHYSKNSQLGGDEEPYLDAIVLGESTFGKGTVQQTVPLRTWQGEKYADAPRQNGRWDRNEPFTDQNANQQRDDGEPFTDLAAPNGRWDDAEPWEDKNGNGTWDEGEKFTDDNKNGRWDGAEEFVDANGNQRYDYGAAVKLTIARYYLPGGKNFTRERYRAEDGTYRYRGGVQPDLETKNERMEVAHLVVLREMQEKGVFSNYVKERWAEHGAALRKLAYFDGRDPQRYPGFDAFYESLRTLLTPQEVRRALRIEVRRATANEIGREILGDLSDDGVLLRGAREVLKRLGVDAATIPEYASLETAK